MHSDACSPQGRFRSPKAGWAWCKAQVLHSGSATCRRLVEACTWILHFLGLLLIFIGICAAAQDAGAPQAWIWFSVVLISCTAGCMILTAPTTNAAKAKCCVRYEAPVVWILAPITILTQLVGADHALQLCSAAPEVRLELVAGLSVITCQHLRCGKSRLRARRSTQKDHF